MHLPKSICGIDSEGIVCTATLAAGTEDISNGDLVEDMMTFDDWFGNTDEADEANDSVGGVEGNVEGVEGNGGKDGSAIEDVGSDSESVDGDEQSNNTEELVEEAMHRITFGGGDVPVELRPIDLDEDRLVEESGCGCKMTEGGPCMTFPTSNRHSCRIGK